MAGIMFKIRNDLRSKLKEGAKTTIYLQYCHQSKVLLFNTKEKVKPLLWNEVKEEVKPKADDAEYINKRLSEKKHKAWLIIQTAKNENIEPTLEYFKSKYLALTAPVFQPIEKPILDLYYSYVERRKKEIRNSSYKHYRVCGKHLKFFLEKEKLTGINPNKITFEIIDSFKDYLSISKNLSNGTANGHIKRLKQFLDDFNKVKSYKDVKLFNSRTDTQQKIYLSADELKDLYKMDLSNNVRLEKVRDLFCLGCVTGLRFSDLAQLRPEHIKHDHLSLLTIKTEKRIDIPLILFAKDIIKKYDGNLPSISNQKMNQYLKELMALSNINEKLILPKWRGKERKDSEPIDKKDLISTHSMKKSFVMLCVNEGVDISVVAEIVGNDPKTLKHYYDVNLNSKMKVLKRVEESFSV